MRSRIAIQLKNGKQVEGWADERYRGGPENPLSDADLEAKVRSCCEGVLNGNSPNAVDRRCLVSYEIGRCLRLDEGDQLPGKLKVPALSKRSADEQSFLTGRNMAGQIEDASVNINSFTTALSLPLFALVLALVLIYLGPPSEPITGGQIIAPDKLDGYRLHLGLRDIAIVFGLSCFPGGLIGAMLGHLILIAQNSKLASASISLLRIGQWAPFVIWWVLVLLLFVGLRPTTRSVFLRLDDGYPGCSLRI